MGNDATKGRLAIQIVGQGHREDYKAGCQGILSHPSHFVKTIKKRYG